MSHSVVAVSCSPDHGFSKPNVPSINLLAGIGVEGDAHAGELVQHEYLVECDPTQPNLRQVHLIHQELFAQVAENGHVVHPGELGENITTRGIDLLAVPRGTVLRLGPDAAVEITGLRNPCGQINVFQSGLMRLLRYRDADGNTVRIGGVMGVVTNGGTVKPGDEIAVEVPAGPHRPLEYIVDSHHPDGAKPDSSDA